MSTYILASALRQVGRRLAPAVLAAGALAGTLGFSSVASASEVVVVGRPAVREVVVAAPRPVVETVVAAPRPVEEVIVGRPRVEEVVVGRPRVLVERPVFYGPRFHARFCP